MVTGEERNLVFQLKNLGSLGIIFCLPCDAALSTTCSSLFLVAFQSFCL